ncbi:hypothetical protein GCM10025865_17310 [Paraoerskovia sediminicola]|uniref:Uncharacterized protein n=1 Tax=Paraoerskovia sediminicola TaxID=1138587 RepID=A0ABM8G2S9_9CELL|nr:hypothetical protein [Paraoerskovia sediminicola]BDZ42432.1 hypothetical protein GCM10025865_17310 [Paraoerskovia sediminicola]
MEEPGDEPSASRVAAGIAIRTCGWCLLILYATLLLLVVVFAVAGPAEDVGPVAYVAALAAIPVTLLTVVVGWPVGWLVAYGMRDVVGVAKHVGALAVVGAVLAAVIVMLVGILQPTPGLAAVFAVAGALGAGGGRLIEDRRRRRRQDTPAVPPGR